MNHFSPDRGYQLPGSSPRRAPSWLRVGALALGAFLTFQAAWILLPEALRPTMPYFPATGTEALAVGVHRSAATFAAGIGWPRGDLATDKALTANASLLSAFVNGRAAQAPAGDDYAAAEHAAELAPADARPWLLLALASAHARNFGKALAQLKMSYYTAPYSEDLFPLRIEITAQLPAIDDRELQDFLQYDLKTTIHDRPDLIQFITSAYRSATPGARQFLETALATLDPKLLGQLRSPRP